MAELLRNPSFLLFWISQVLSGIGNTLYYVGVAVTIFERTGSTLQTALLTVFLTGPSILFGSFAGAIIDRSSRRRVLALCEIFRVVFLLILLVVVTRPELNLPAIYALVFGLAICETFFEPASKAIIPSLAKPHQIVHANSLLIGTLQATMAIGFLAGSVLLVSLSLPTLLWWNLGAFLLSGLILLFLPIRSLPPKVEAGKDAEAAEDESFLRSVATGLSSLRKHAVAGPLVLMELLEHIPHGIWASALMLVFAKDALGGDAATWGYICAGFFGGQLLGAIAATMASGLVKRHAGRMIIINAFIFSLMTVGFALSPTPAFAIGLCVVFGFPSSFRDVAQDSLLQTAVPDRLLGRVFAIRGMLASLAFVLASLAFAWASDRTGIRAIYLIGGGLYFLTAFYALSRKAIREATLPA